MMKPRSRLVLGSVLLLCATLLPAQPPAYHVARKIKLGGEGRWDYVTFDGAGQRLFIARETHVMVVDAASGALLGDIPGLHGAHGVALAPESGHGFATSGDDGMVLMFDLRTLKVLGSTPAALDVDAILYDPSSRRVFAFSGDAQSSTVIDPATGKSIGTIPFSAKPESGVSMGDGRLYVNLESRGTIAEIDAAKMRVTREWPLAPCNSPTGLAVDREHHRLFSGCRNKVMAISDATGGKLIKTLPIGEGVDGCAFDPGTRLAFASNGEGTLSVVHEESPDAFKVEATVLTQKGARTLALDEKTHRLFTVTSQMQPPKAGNASGPRPRPLLVPDTFSLLVLEP